MLCLGIETSCDETALALVGGGRLVGEIVASQARLHAIFGGVVPELASREHYRLLPALLDALLEENSIDIKAIDCVAVARGPGLLGSLLVGTAFAKGLSLGLGIPLLGVNHLHAHLLAACLGREPVFPALGLIISGGHTNFYRMEASDKFLPLGRSLDDAAGEAFDKVGHALGFSYPAGQMLDKLAQDGDASACALPRPYLDNDNLDFSFSGLKTAAVTAIAELGLEGAAQAPQKRGRLADFCASFNLAMSDTLAVKFRRAILRNPDVECLYAAGGVAANSSCRKAFLQLAADFGKRIAFPDPTHCTDNAAMIAWNGYLLASQGFYHLLDLETIPRGRPIPDDMLTSLPDAAPK